MPYVSVDGVNIYHEVTGAGFPLILSHEFAGDYRSWDAQVSFFGRRYQVITYNARGYPPSDVPTDPGAYSQAQAVEDLHAVLCHLGIGRAYVGGLSMGGGTALHFGFAYPDMTRALIVAATGSGSVNPQQWRQEAEANARRFEEEGMEVVAEDYALGPARVQLQCKDPKGWAEFKRALAGHSALGAAFTFRGVQMKRPSILDMGHQLRQLRAPTLILIGDEDEPCIEPAIFMKRNIPAAGLAVLPKCGHTINLEEPDLFNRTVLDFLTAVEAGHWSAREQPVEGAPLLAR